MKPWRMLFLVFVILAAVAVELSWPHIRNELFVLVGNRDEAGGFYGFWSGFGGALQVFTLTCGGGLLYWHKTCHVHKCLRIGKHPVEGTGIVTCRKHHPVLGQHRKLTVEKVFHLHQVATAAAAVKHHDTT
jgi:hypothetical protein